MKATLDTATIIHQEQALRQAAGQAVYNTSPFTLRDLTTRASQQRLTADFEATISGKRCVVEYELDTNLAGHRAVTAPGGGRCRGIPAP